MTCFNFDSGVYFFNENTNFKDFRKAIQEWEEANEDLEEEDYEQFIAKYKPQEGAPEKF